MIENNIMLGIGEIFRFQSTKISSDLGHFFVIIGISEGLVYYVCLSSGETKKNYIERMCLPESTLVIVKPKKGLNKLRLDSYANCNSILRDDLADFLKRISKSEREHPNRVRDSELYQLLQGAIDSTATSEIEKELFRSNLKTL